jgi:ribosomal protein L12E/L44/L45/RPP1/RPP2
MAEAEEKIDDLDPDARQVYDSFLSIIKKASDAFSYIVIENVRKAMKSPEVKSHVNSGILTYIAAAGALTFAGRNVEKDSVARLIRSVDIKPEDELLDAVGVFRAGNSLVYMMCIYFLTSVKQEPNVKNLLEVVKAMEMTPDITIADSMLVYYREFEQKEASGTLDYSDSDSYVIIIADVVRKVGMATSYLLEAELRRALLDPRIKQVMNKGIVPYLAAAGMLAYAGKDIDRWGIAKLVKSIGIDPEPELLDAMTAVRFRNHIVYLISIYFLIAAGKEPNVENLIKVVRAMYIDPDSTLAAFSIRTFGKFDNQIAQ